MEYTRGMPADLHFAAALAIADLVIFIAVMDWVPTPLNRNITGMGMRDRLPGTVIHTALGTLFAAANFSGWLWVILAGAVWFSVVLVSAVRNWWIPYLTGTADGEITPEIYAQHYSQNLTVLPSFRGHPIVPDLQHCLIHLSVLVAAGLSWVSFFFRL